MFAMLDHVRLPVEVIVNMPASVRVVARYAQHSSGRATTALQPLPNFLIIRAQEGGTTALFAYLRWNPEIMARGGRRLASSTGATAASAPTGRVSPHGPGDGSSPAGAACGPTRARGSRRPICSALRSSRRSFGRQ
jgi:hypothetical protein